MPLNSVAASLRRLADGDLDARTVAPDQSLGEAALLVDDFNSMANRLKRMAEEQAFWNAAIAHELRHAADHLARPPAGLAEGVFEPDTAQFYSLLTQVEGLTRLVEDLRVVGLGDSGYLRARTRLRRPGRRPGSRSTVVRIELAQRRLRAAPGPAQRPDTL